MSEQQVFVVDRAAFFDGDWPHGYQPIAEPAAFLDRAMRLGRFVDRDEAERTPAWKQWIPYCMLRCGDWTATGAAGDRGILLVQRTAKGGEARLHESWTVGLGGHIEPVDAPAGGSAEPDAETFFAAALQRELDEELRLPDGPLPAPRLLGLINDDTTEVGSVHAGLAYCIDLPEPLPRARTRFGIREISKLRGGFTHLVEFAELWQTPSQFETWSQFLIQAEIVGTKGGRSWTGTTSA
ncbi:MAG: NUDIX domain-containing protein [Planctomycetes bacterium]|nr:NUDIX domain-containing protein [Planctomycetota bacterium]